MIYLDYSATTPAEIDVVERFAKLNQIAFANPNSVHRAGKEANDIVLKANHRILQAMGLEQFTVIQTSGATEANNLAIKGIALAMQTRGKHVITTAYEHSSVTACFNELQRLGYEVEIVSTLPDGSIDLDDLRSLLRADTILVSIAAVSSELGIAQPLAAIAEVVHQERNALFHSDITQAIGKIEVAFGNLDLMTFTAHKIYGLKGVGALVLKDSLALIPQIHGGRSTSAFRSGTPSAPLADSLAEVVERAIRCLPERISQVAKTYDHFERLGNEFPGLVFNRTARSIPQIVNFSLPGYKAFWLQQQLSDFDIMVSTQSACRESDSASLAVLRLFHDEARATSSLRVSLSHLTTTAEIDAFFAILRRIVQL
ncbi:MAG: cysteine desulfurase [Bacillus subtilis]|nr:cysteine desulfurase [Bacillus subtilis]